MGDALLRGAGLGRGAQVLQERTERAESVQAEREAAAHQSACKLSEARARVLAARNPQGLRDVAQGLAERRHKAKANMSESLAGDGRGGRRLKACARPCRVVPQTPGRVVSRLNALEGLAAAAVGFPEHW